VDGEFVEKYLWLDKITLLATYDKDDQLVQRFEYVLGNTPTSYTQNGNKYYIISDHLGTPRAITNANGDILKQVDYDSFGNVISDSAPEISIPFGFAGGLADSDTGLVRFGYRDYDPETGRWTARDPIGFAGGDTNLYGYVFSDPINYFDPTGLVNQSVVNFLAGLGDALLLGQGDRIRDALAIDGGISKCSKSYKAGAITAFAAGGARIAYAGLAKAGSVLASTGTAASNFRAGLKTAFRLGFGRKWRPPNLAGKTQAQLRHSAGKTNPGVNIYGGGVGAAGAAGATGGGD